MHQYPLPQNVQYIADIIGRSQALNLVGQLPRTAQTKRDTRTRHRIYLHVPKPENLKASCKLVQILGINDSLKLSRVFGGEVLYIPSCKQMSTYFLHHSIRKQFNNGVPIEILVICFGMSRRNILKILA